MTTPLLPAPDAADDRSPPGADDHCHEQPDQRSPGAGAKRRVASEEECLAALHRLPALVALGMLTTAQANTIRGTYTAILQHYRQKRNTVDRGGIADDALVGVLSRHPELANLLEPLLSREQIELIIARATDGTRGTS